MTLPTALIGLYQGAHLRWLVMVTALISPELMITWAARQFLNAHDIPHAKAAEDFNVTFSAQSATTLGDDQDISESPAMLAGDVSEADRSSSAPGRYVKFKRQLYAWTLQLCGTNI